MIVSLLIIFYYIRIITMLYLTEEVLGDTVLHSSFNLLKSQQVAFSNVVTNEQNGKQTMYVIGIALGLFTLLIPATVSLTSTLITGLETSLV